MPPAGPLRSWRSLRENIQGKCRRAGAAAVRPALRGACPADQAQRSQSQALSRPRAARRKCRSMIPRGPYWPAECKKRGFSQRHQGTEGSAQTRWPTGTFFAFYGFLREPRGSVRTPAFRSQGLGALGDLCVSIDPLVGSHASDFTPFEYLMPFAREVSIREL